MAQRTIVELLDDVDGTNAAETVTFGLDGTTYEIDLSEKNAAALRKALVKWVEHGRKVSRTRPATATASKSRGSRDSERPRLVREWAKANGHKVPDRGRIPQEVSDAYDAAH